MKRIIYGFAGLLAIALLSACSNTSTEPAAESDTEKSVTGSDTDAETQQADENKEIVSTEVALSLVDFWKLDGTNDTNEISFVTGLEIIFPEDWIDKIVISTDIGPVDRPISNTLLICEKANAKANAGGVLFNLVFWHKEENVTYEIFPMDTVLGVYEQGQEEYALILEIPRELNYVEGNDEMKAAYENLSKTLDDVQINMDNMPGFRECGIDEIDWIKYQ